MSLLSSMLSPISAATFDTLTVSGAAVFKGTISVSGAAHFKTTVSVGGAATFADTVTVSGAAIFKTNLTVEGTTTLSGAAVAKTTMNIQGAATLDSTLSVSAGAHFKTTISVGGAAIFGDNLTVAGTTTLSGGATLKTTLNVEGATTLSGAAVLKASLNVEGATTLSGVAIAKSAVTAESTLTISGATVAKTTLTVEGASTLSGAVVAKSTFLAESTVTISGAAVLKSTFQLDSANINRKGADIASATTTDLSTATGDFVDITGTTTITGLGTVTSGVERVVRFTGILTLTHNATSLILPGSANITTANGDTAIFRSLGAGNWKCVSYTKQSGASISDGGGTVTNVSVVTANGFSGTVATSTTTPAITIVGTTAQFIAKVASQAADVTGDGTNYDVVFGTEISDPGSNFSSTTFTAPITGLYQFNISIDWLGLITGERVGIILTTSNRTYTLQYLQPFTISEAGGEYYQAVATLADMDVNDTAKVTVFGAGGAGTKTTDIEVNSYFSGSLVR